MCIFRERRNKMFSNRQINVREEIDLDTGKDKWWFICSICHRVMGKTTETMLTNYGKLQYGLKNVPNRN